MLSEKYKAVIKQTSNGPQWDNGDPVVGKVMQLVVQPYSGQDLSMDPTAYEPAKPGKAEGLKMIPLVIDRNAVADQARIKAARHREFTFGRSDGTDTTPGPSRPTVASATAWTRGASLRQRSFPAKRPRRVSAATAPWKCGRSRMAATAGATRCTCTSRKA